jgi:effector-binding domain-containing protein
MTASAIEGSESPMTGAVELIDLHPQAAAVVHAYVPLSGIEDFLGSAYAEIMTVLAEQDLTPAGPPFGRWQPRGDGFDAVSGFDAVAGFPSTAPITPAGRVEPYVLPEGMAATAVHRGDYAGVGATYGVLYAWIAGHGFVPTEEPWECYLDEPDVPEPRTQVYVPCAKAQPQP